MTDRPRMGLMGYTLETISAPKAKLPSSEKLSKNCFDKVINSFHLDKGFPTCKFDESFDEKL